MFSLKPRILIIPDKTLWVIGEIAKQIVNVNTGFEYIIISRSYISKHPDIYQKLLSDVDLVHLLTPYDSIKLLNNAQCPTVITLHHCVQENIKSVEGISHCQQIIVLANEWKKFLLSLGCDGDKIEIIPNGIDSRYFVNCSINQKKNYEAKTILNMISLQLVFLEKKLRTSGRGPTFY